MNHAIEKTRPLGFFAHSKPAVGRIPEEIRTLLSLMNLKAACYEYGPVNKTAVGVDEPVVLEPIPKAIRYWEITNDKTLKYARIDADTIGQDPDKWREVIGLLLDHGNGELK